MDLSELSSLFADQVLGVTRRTLRLAWSEALQAELGPMLLPQRAHVSEGICEPSVARIDCLSTCARLPLQQFLGLPVALQWLTDRDELRSIPLVITEASLGRCDGALAAVHLVARDAMSLMAERRRLRCFEQRSAAQVLQEVFGEWQRQGLGRCFSFRWLGGTRERQPVRGCFIQHPDESDAGFAQRLLRGAGIAWCWRPDAEDLAHRRNGLPRQELLLFEDSRSLPEDEAGRWRFHRRDASLPGDSIDLLSPRWRLVPGGVALHSWNHESAQMDLQRLPTGAGDALTQALGAARVAVPHLGDDREHLGRLVAAQADHQRLRSQALLGRGGVRTLAPGTHQVIDGFPGFEGLAEHERDHVVLRVEHLALNNLPAELHAPALALLGDAGWPAWAHGEPGEVLNGDGAKPPQRYVNRFEAVPRAVPVVPPPWLEHEQPPLRSLTGLVVAPSNMHVLTDALGRSRVQLLGGEPGADTTAWVRHRTPWAGEGVGFSAQLRPGTEVDIEWLGPDRPVIAGCHYNGRTAPPRVAHLPGLPLNASHTALVGRELGGRRQQHLLLDDYPGRPMAQLASEAGHSALSLGELSTPRREGEAQPRGNGFELRSDDSGAIRTAKALLLSAWARLEASGGQLSAEEHVALMQECLELFRSLGRYAAGHQGLGMDEAGQDKLLSDVKGAPGGSNVDPRGESGAPTLSLTAPAGIAATTPKTILHYAGVNLDQVAQQQLQLTAGQRLTAHAGQGLSWFAHQGGIQAIAHHGRWLLQSQHGDTQIDSGRDVQLSATRRMVLTAGEELLFVLSDGTALRLSKAGIELISQQPLTGRTAAVRWLGPGSVAATLPSFDAGTASQRFVLRVGSSDGPVAADQPYEITLSDGSTRRGRSDAQGLTELLQHEAMHIARIRILNDQGEA